MTKRAFSIFELIVVIFISSIVLIYTFKFLKETYEIQIQNEKIAILKIDLNSTKIILKKNLPTSINKLKYKNQTLYYENNILLKNVTAFSINKSSKQIKISITLQNLISQTWIFAL